jgi:REase_AHJR-like
MANTAEKSETDILRVLRSRYEKDGYTFVAHPTGELVPAFLGKYRPDALALSENESVVIEIKTRKGTSTEGTLAQIAKRVASQPNWKFRVYYTSDFSRPAFQPASKASVLDLVEEIEKLRKAGFVRASFVMAWTALEAFARLLHANESGADSAMIPSEIIEWLTQSGNIDPPVGRMLRSVVRTRNAVVHGDTSVEIKPHEMLIMKEALDVLKRQLESHNE